MSWFVFLFCLLMNVMGGKNTVNLKELHWSRKRRNTRTSEKSYRSALSRERKLELGQWCTQVGSARSDSPRFVKENRRKTKQSKIETLLYLRVRSVVASGGSHSRRHGKNLLYPSSLEGVFKWTTPKVKAMISLKRCWVSTTLCCVTSTYTKARTSDINPYRTNVENRVSS